MKKHLKLFNLLFCLTMHVGVTQADDLQTQMEAMQMRLTDCLHMQTIMKAVALEYAVLLADNPECERLEQDTQRLAVKIREREIAFENMKAATAARNYARKEHSAHEAICLG